MKSDLFNYDRLPLKTRTLLVCQCKSVQQSQGHKFELNMGGEFELNIKY